MQNMHACREAEMEVKSEGEKYNIKQFGFVVGVVLLSGFRV